MTLGIGASRKAFSFQVRILETEYKRIEIQVSGVYLCLCVVVCFFVCLLPSLSMFVCLLASFSVFVSLFFSSLAFLLALHAL